MKYIVAYDTICQGWQCTKDEQEKPVLFDSALEAWREILDSAISHAKANPDFTEVTPEQIARMEMLEKTGTLEKIIAFFDNNPDCNEYEEFVVTEADYMEGRKTIFNLA